MIQCLRASLRRNQVFASVVLTSAVFLAGCGLGMRPGAGAPDAPTTLDAVQAGGQAMGGNQPIVGGTVNIYETSSTNVSAVNGVYVPSTPLTPLNATPATTDSNGNFHFTPSVTCNSASDYTYITISGGSAGGGANSNILLMAYSGPCSAIQPFTWVNEVTTVASAYALSGFISISGSTVSVTSSATNYATVVANTHAGTLSMAGLAHAILNAQNLANFGGATGTTANAAGTLPGQANTTTVALNGNVACGTGCTPGGGNTQSAYLPSFVPQAEINSIADVLQACVSSNGVTTANPSGGATNVSFTATSAATATSGSTSTLTINGSEPITGQFNLAVNGGSATAINVPIGSNLSALASAINGNATYASEGFSAAAVSNVLTLTGPNTNAYTYPYSFSTPSTPTGSAGATSTISFNIATSISGTVQIAVAGGAPVSGSVSGTSASTFASSFNGVSAFSGASLTANSSGSTVTITGPIGTSNTLDFTGTSLTGTETQVPAFTGTALAQDTDDGTSCGRLFGFAPSLAGTVPTNTLQAALNLAHNPYANGASAALFNLIPASSGAPFTPTLSAPPPDWTISIVYTAEYQAPSASATYTYPFYLTLDASDNVYTQVPNASGSSTGTSLYSMTSNGYLNYATGGASTGQTCPGTSCTINSTTSSGANSFSYQPNIYNMAADGYGNLWVVTNSGSSPTFPVLQINTSTGNVIQSYYGLESSNKGVAVDKAGDVWLGRTNTSNNILAEIVYNGTGVVNAVGNGSSSTVGLGTCTAGSCGTPYGPYASGKDYTGVGFGATSGGVINGPYGMTVDKNQNIWYAGYYNGGNTINVLPYVGASSVSISACSSNGYATTYYGAYSGLICSGNTVTNSTANPYYLTGTMGTGTTPYGVAVDGSGNGWITNSSGSSSALQKFTPTYGGSGYSSGGTLTAIPSSPTASYGFGTSSSSARFMEADGAGNIWVPDAGLIGVFEFNAGTTSFVTEPAGFQPCLVVGTVCGTENNNAGGTASALTGVREVMIDSTGSVWIPAGTSSKTSGFNNIVQIIGTAAPTWWPGATNPGVMP